MTDALLTVSDQQEALSLVYAQAIEKRRKPMKVSIQDKKALLEVSPSYIQKLWMRERKERIL